MEDSLSFSLSPSPLSLSLCWHVHYCNSCTVNNLAVFSLLEFHQRHKLEEVDLFVAVVVDQCDELLDLRAGEAVPGLPKRTLEFVHVDEAVAVQVVEIEDLD